MLIPGRQALRRGDFAAAAQIAEQHLRADQGAADGWYVLGMALAETGHVARAIEPLARAAALAPTDAEYAAMHARVLAQAQRDAEARAAATRATALPGDDPLVLDTIGCVLARLGDHGAALPLFARAVAARPDNLSFRFNYASSLGFFGEAADAADQYEAILARDPAHGAAHLGLAGLGLHRPAADHLARIGAAIPLARDHADRVRLHYAAARLLEDLGQADAAFAHLDTANRAHKAMTGYRAADDAALADALSAAFARADYFAGPGDDALAPIFVVGLPRTGTTLVDRILAAHPQVQALGELQAMPLALKRLTRSPSRLVLDPATIELAGSLAPGEVARAYWAQASAQAGATAAEGRPVDKFPLNFLYAGHIARAFPRARIVCLRRHPLDSVWSNYKHLFALNSPYYRYSHDLVDTALYYALFDRMIALWRQVCPDQLLELSYEALIDDQEGQTRRLLAHCGLPWDAACMDFHRHGGAVATPSAQQVRRPLNRASVGRWQAYADHLAPAAQVLRERGISF